MRKSVLILFCLLLMCSILFGGYSWMRYSPRGVLNDSSPEKAMQSVLNDYALSDWERALRPLWNQDVTRFEDADSVFSKAFEQIAGGDSFQFREADGLSSSKEPVFVISSGDRDLCLAYASYSSGQWEITRFDLPETVFSVNEYTLSITVPDGSEVFCNGVKVDNDFLVDEQVPYEDMTELEKRFSYVPHAVRYEIPGMFDTAEIEVSDDCVLSYSDGANVVYEKADKGSYSFRIKVPSGSEVTVNGAVLTSDDCEKTESRSFSVTLPDIADRNALCYDLYSCSGLYSQPEICVLSDGNVLEAKQEGEFSLYALPGNDILSGELSTTVEDFLEKYCRYGAHHFGYSMLTPYLVENTELYNFIVNSQASLIWINGENVTFKDISSFDYQLLGAGCCICTAHVSCTTKTWYETQELELDYELVFVKQDNVWLLYDMAYI